MMTKYRLAVLTLGSICGAVGWVSGCTARDGTPEYLGQSSSAVSPAATNYHVTPTVTTPHEESVAYASGCSNGLMQPTGKWVVGYNSFNGSTTTQFGWSYSGDNAGTTWTDNEITSGTQLGSPPTNSPSNGTAFTGWRGDPSLAFYGDPSNNNNNQRVVYTMVAQSLGGANDVVVAKSDDCGQTWGDVQWVNTATTGGSVDNPTVASNPAVASGTSVGTWVAWDVLTSPYKGYINQITYAADGGFTAGTPVQIPAPPSPDGVFHPNIVVGGYWECALRGAQAVTGVLVAFAGQQGAGCTYTNGGSRSTINEDWYVALYDTNTGTWPGAQPWLVDSDSANPRCVGSPVTTSNDPRPRITMDPTYANGTTGKTPFWFTYVKGTTYGTRINVYGADIICNGATPHPSGSTWQAPEPCDYNGTTYCHYPSGTVNPDGGPEIQDEWGPAIGFSLSTGGPTALVTWYDTRSDLNNDLVGIYSAQSTSGASFGTAQPVAVSVATGGTSEVVPWDHSLADWKDYQGMAAALDNRGYLNGIMLGAWGGDARNGASSAGIWSSLFQ